MTVINFIFNFFLFAFLTPPCILSFDDFSEVKTLNREKAQALFFRSLRAERGVVVVVVGGGSELEGWGTEGL